MASARRLPRLTTTRREEERVTALELFFDLVFVLALTQCTALMADDPTWTGVLEGLAVLAVLWWSWCGYAWLTSTVDPEEGSVRIVIFVAMAAFLVAALCVPEAFGDLGLTFVIAYAVVRIAQIGLYLLASRGEPELHRSVVALATSTSIGISLLLTASFFDGWTHGVLWAVAIILDYGGPFLFGIEGWRLFPEHFAERHGLIIIIALGESIVAIGVGAEGGVDAGIMVAAVLGIALAAAQWWAYFDVVAIAATHRLVGRTPGRQQNAMARDSYSYLHLVMVAGIMLVAFGLKKTLEHVGDPLKVVPATALVGGAALYLVGHLAFRLRNMGSLNRQRLVVVVVLLVVVLPIAPHIAAIVTVGIVAGVHAGLIAYEALHFASARHEIRHGHATL
jgi:low temperature requirement protein LtrA